MKHLFLALAESGSRIEKKKILDSPAAVLTPPIGDCDTQTLLREVTASHE